MKINKSFKFRIYSNSQQKQFLSQSFGCARFVYNHFLRQRIDYYAETGKGLTYHNNALALTQLKKQSELEWLNDINSQSLQQHFVTLMLLIIISLTKKLSFQTSKRNQISNLLMCHKTSLSMIT